MNYSQLEERIRQGEVSPVYLLYGEEHYIIQQLEHAIIDQLLTPDERDCNLTVLDGDPKPEELIGLLETVPFLGGKQVIVIHNTAFFRAAKQDNAEVDESGKSDKSSGRLLKVLADMPDYTCLVLTTIEKVDKRRKLFKQIEKCGIALEAISFKPWDTKNISQWVQAQLGKRQKKIAANAMEAVLAMVGSMPRISLVFLEAELEKLSLYTGNRTIITLQDLEAVLASVPELSVFALLEAIGQKQVAKALPLLDRQLAAGEHPAKLIGLLAREIRLLWRIKEMVAAGLPAREIGTRTGLVNYICEKKIKQSQQFGIAQLRQALLSLAQADTDFKSSQANEAVLEEIVIRLCHNTIIPSKP